MAKYSNVVQYNIVTDVDTSGIVKLQNELTKLKQSLKFDKGGFNQLGFDDAKIDQSIKKVNQLQSALTAAFNPKIGTLDLGKLNTSLQKEHTSLQMIVKDWEQMGTRGTMAISNLSNALLSMNKGAINVNTTLSKVANTFGNTVRWGITASIFQEMMSSVQGAVSYMKDLDESLTQIQMVTNSSKEDMRELAQYANQAAQALGSTTTDYTNAVKVFVQEGFSESESKQYANLSTKLANVSEQNTATTSDQITAYRNAFQLDYKQTVEAMDKVANVANNTASNVNELMTASQRAASVAQAVGTSQDSFLASIATIESVTRQSAEEIGNGLKTIYQRFADIKTGKSAEDGVDYGQYANALKSIGVDVLDAAGQFKGMDQILKETQEVWSGLSETMKVAVGEKVAGKFQYNRFAALMNNPEYYQKALDATQNADGMMDQMNEHYMNSIEGRLNTLQAAGEQVMSTLFDQDSIEPIIEQVTELVNGLNDIVTAVGGLNGLLPALSAIMLRTFSTQIAGSVSNIASSIGNIVSNTVNSNNLNTSVELLGLKNYSQSGGSSVAGKLVSGVAGNYDQLSVGTQEKIRDLSQQIVELEEQKNNILKEQEQYFKKINENAIEEKNLLNQQRREYVEELSFLKKKQQAGKASAEEIEKATTLENETIPILRKKIESYKNISKEVNGYIAKLASGEKLNSNVANRLAEMKKEADRLGISIGNLEELMERLDVASNNLRIGDKMVDAAIKSATLESNINNMIKGLSGFTSISFGISMISESFKVLGDETSSLKEKFEAVTINGLMGITMLIPGIMQSVSAVKELGKAWEIWRAQQAATLAITELSNAQEGIRIGLRKDIIKQCAVESLEQGKLNKEKMTELLVLNGYKTTAAKSIATKTANLAIDEASEKVTTRQIIGTTLRTTVTETLTAALIKLGLAEEYATVAAGPLGIALAAVVVVAGAAFAAVNQMAEAEEKRKQQLEEQLDASNQVIQKLNETEDAYNEAYDSYKRTGEASEDLKNKSIELAEALKIEGAQAFANAGMYDELNEKIQQATINQREYNNALLEQQIEDLNKQNSTYNYDWQNMVYGADGSLVGTGPIPASITSSEEIIANKKRNVEETEKEIAAEREKLLYLDNTSESYVEQKQKLDDLIKSKQEYLVQNELDENQQKELDAYRQRAENSVNIAKDTGLFDNIQNFQQIIDMLKEDSSVNEYLSMLGEDEANAWIQSFVEQILAGKEDILEAFHLAITPDTNSKYNFSDDILQALGATYDELTGSYKGGFQLNDQQAKLIKQYEANSEIKIGDEVIGFADYLKKDGLWSVKEFVEALVDSKGAIFEFTEQLSDIQGAQSLSDLDYERSKLEAQGPLNQEQQKQYDNQLDKLTQEAAKAYDIDFEDIVDQAKAFREELNLTEGAARDLAIQNQRMTKGIDALYNGWEDWSKILATSDHAAKDYIDTMQEATAAIADLVGASKDLELSNEFFESAENLADIQLAAEGDIDAIDRLGIAVGTDMVNAMDAFTEAEREAAAALDLSDTDSQIIANKITTFDNAKAKVLSGLDEIKLHLDDLQNGADVSEFLNTEDWVNALNTLAVNTQMTVEQMNSLLGSIGMKADVKVEHVKTTVQVPEYVTEESVEQIKPARQIWDDSGDDLVGTEPALYRKTSRTYINRYVPHEGYIDVAQISTGGDAGTPSISYVGNGPVSYSSTPSGRSALGSGSSGKSSSPKSNTPKQNKSKNNEPKDYQNSEWDYLTDITNDLEREETVLKRLSKLEDRLYGADRVSQLKKIQKEQTKRIGLLEKEIKLAERHLDIQKNRKQDENGNLTVRGYANQANIQLQYDKEGNIDNGRQIEITLLDKLNKAIENYNIHRNDEDASQFSKQVDIAKENYNGFLKAFSEYEKTLGVIEDAQDEIQEGIEELQNRADQIIDTIQSSIESIIDAIDNRRDYEKMYQDWFEGGSSFSHFDNEREYYAKGIEGSLSSVFNKQLDNLKRRLADVEDVYDDSPDKINDKKVNQTDARENLREATESIVKTLQTMINQYDSLLKTADDASKKMDEIIDNRLNRFDRLENFLDTRLDQLKLLYGDKSYEQQAQFYNRKTAVYMEKMVNIQDAIKEKQVTVKHYEELQAEGKELSTEELEGLENARNKINELQEAQLRTETAILESNQNELRAKASAEARKMVNSIFGGVDVDWLSQEWEIASRQANKYLDDYNKAYEIQKLQLKFQDALNNSQQTSLATQQKITSLADEYLGFLRQKTKVSEYDVKFAEKQLEILQQQIALEEAQNNKSQMRLQRNAAGNYDFVYAADEDAINQAKRALLSLQQEAYNLAKQMQVNTYEDLLNFGKQIEDMTIELTIAMANGVEGSREHIEYVLETLKQYVKDSRIDINETYIDLYNSFVDSANTITQENQGRLADLYKEMSEGSSGLKQTLNDNTNSVQETGLEAFDNTASKASSTATDIVGSWTGMQGDIISKFDQMGSDVDADFQGMSDNTGIHLEKIKKGTIDTSDEIDEKVTDVSKNIDGRFKIMEEHSIDSTENVDGAIDKAFQNIVGTNGYLDEYEKTTDETLGHAQTTYEDFAKNAIDEANSELGELRASTTGWDGDLQGLNTTIGNCTEKMKELKPKIDNAIESADNFIDSAYSWEQHLGEVAYEAARAADELVRLKENSKVDIAVDYTTTNRTVNIQENWTYDNGNLSSGGVTDYNGSSPSSSPIISSNNSNSNNNHSYSVELYANGGGSHTESGFSSRSAAESYGISQTSSGSYYDRYKIIQQYASGGYTGTWFDGGIDNKDGKLAILHQKELVLNQTDTENMLSAVEIVRDIMSGINSVSSLNKTLNSNTIGNTIEQRVEISATFPGVTEAIEIKQALEQLADNAYQAANKYKY